VRFFVAPLLRTTIPLFSIAGCHAKCSSIRLFRDILDRHTFTATIVFATLFLNSHPSKRATMIARFVILPESIHCRKADIDIFGKASLVFIA
jgi:hypothetical protein